MKATIKVNGIKVVMKALQNIQPEFSDETPDEYKNGFTDCMNAIIHALQNMSNKVVEE